MSAVVHIITALERGGAQRIALETVAQLHHHDRPQWLITGSFGDTALIEEARERLGKRLIIVPALNRPIQPRQDAQAFVGIYRCLRQLSQSLGTPLVVHTHSSKAGVLGRLAAHAVGNCHIIHTVHGFGFGVASTRSQWLLEAAERMAGAVTNVLIFVSESDRDLALRLKLAPKATYQIIRAALDPAPFVALRKNLTIRAEARHQWNIPEDVPLIVTVANCKPQKDPLFHIEVFKEFLELEPNAWFLFVGDGVLKSALVQRITELGLTQKIVLPGFIADSRLALAAGDIFLLASRWEGLPRSVLEAMASGLPVVVRNSTGWADELHWSKRLWSLEKDAPASAFAQALHQALLSKNTNTLNYQDNKTDAHFLPEEFTLDGMLERLDILYKSLYKNS